MEKFIVKQTYTEGLTKGLLKLGLDTKIVMDLTEDGVMVFVKFIEYQVDDIVIPLSEIESLDYREAAKLIQNEFWGGF